ncbi:hypothetical protein BJY16_000166 [Actinoplanes octamycinicus]|uniref:Uncharacterized protein n=1 Tax=Actinoplanes octamycinicus TaxID=135948 RepID=A0A7W7GR26_9ACTN|nr:hypothetical protein [Actinoplanes octamycinicus]MBB4736707.1 hypothetical protein [Actinoplanes octamycinicus]GIE60474.1 hypothetical protein Aoc01nite_58760 [Actinoplanes octamycinicus]
MAGLLVLGPGADWVVSGGLFDWVLEFLRARISAPEAKAHLREIVDNNLGSFWLAELSPAARDEAMELLRHELVEAGRQELPDGDGKADVIRRLQELADLAGSSRRC